MGEGLTPYPVGSVKNIRPLLSLNSMKANPSDIAVFGATGATGRLLVAELLSRGETVRAVVRSAERLPIAVREHGGLKIVEGPVSDWTDAQLANHLQGCKAAASCLGHNLTFRGVYGKPRRLVTDTARRVCAALAADGVQDAPAKRFVLMNSAGVRHRGQNEPIPIPQHAVLWLLRLLLPPHADNEQAAEHLRTRLDPAGPVQWAVVRPDALINHDGASAYDAHPAPTRSAIFNSGKTSRINVAHFMAELLTNDTRWSQWAGQMPVLYNQN